MATLAGSYNGLSFGPGTSYHVSGVEGLWDADGVEDRDLPKIGNGSFVGRDRMGGRRLILTLTLIADTHTAYDTLVSDLIDATEPGAGDNLLTANQASIETDASGWVDIGANATLSRSTAQAREGAGSLLMTPVATGNVSVATSPIAKLPIVPGRTYRAIASLRSTGTGRTVQVRLRLFNSAGTYLGDTTVASGTDASTGWTDLTGTYTVAVAGAVLADVQATVLAAAEAHYLDRVALHQGSSTAWTEGGKHLRLERPLRLMGNTVYVNARPRRRIIPIATDTYQRTGVATIEFFASNPAVYTGAP